MHPDTPEDIRRRLAQLDAFFTEVRADAGDPGIDDVRRVMQRLRRFHLEGPSGRA